MRALGWVGLLAFPLGCADPELETGVAIGDACDGEDTVTCARLSPNDGEPTQVAACRDGMLRVVVSCATWETCTVPIPGTAACTSDESFAPYAIEAGACPTEDALACNTQRSHVLSCAQGQWEHELDCAEQSQRCQVPQGGDVPGCGDPP